MSVYDEYVEAFGQIFNALSSFEECATLYGDSEWQLVTPTDRYQNHFLHQSASRTVQVSSHVPFAVYMYTPTFGGLEEREYAVKDRRTQKEYTFDPNCNYGIESVSMIPGVHHTRIYIDSANRRNANVLHDLTVQEKQQIIDQYGEYVAIAVKVVTTSSAVASDIDREAIDVISKRALNCKHYGLYKTYTVKQILEGVFVPELNLFFDYRLHRDNNTNRIRNPVCDINYYANESILHRLMKDVSIITASVKQWPSDAALYMSLFGTPIKLKYKIDSTQKEDIKLYIKGKSNNLPESIIFKRDTDLKTHLYYTESGYKTMFVTNYKLIPELDEYILTMEDRKLKELKDDLEKVKRKLEDKTEKLTKEKEDSKDKLKQEQNKNSTLLYKKSQKIMEQEDTIQQLKSQVLTLTRTVELYNTTKTQQLTDTEHELRSRKLEVDKDKVTIDHKRAKLDHEKLLIELQKLRSETSRQKAKELRESADDFVLSVSTIVTTIAGILSIVGVVTNKAFKSQI